MLVRLLGPVELEDGDGRPIAVGGSKERAVVAVLAVHANQVVAEDLLIESLWGDEPPRTAARTLQGYVSRVRKALTEAGADARSVLDSSTAGWVLRVGPGTLDVADVERLVGIARAATARGDHVGAALSYADALAWWRGRPLGELGGMPWAVIEAARLAELRQHLVEQRIDAELACGRHAELVGELEALCRAHPVRERPWHLLMLALHRSGRQAEALRAYQQLREHLAEELGIEPSRELRALEQAVLDHDPALDWRPAPVEAQASSAPSAPPGVEPPSVTLPSSGVVTLMFTDIVGSTSLLGRLGDEGYEWVRQAHFQMLRAEIEAAGGVEVKSLGDGLFAAFAEPDGAITAAVRIQQAVARRNRRSADERLDVRIGVQAGPVKLHDGDYFGTPVVVARRLCDGAHDGQILTTNLVADLMSDRDGWDLGPSEERAFKGLEEPVITRAVRWAEQGPRPLPPALVSQRAADFVGRAAELEAVQASWGRAQLGRGNVLLLAGEPGIGKTALAVQVAEDAWREGGVVLFGRCDEESVVAFQPWVESLATYVATTRPGALRAQLGTQAADLALLLPELSHALPELSGVAGTGADTERYRIVAAVAALVRAIADEAPVLLILDDLHWADAPTLHLLRQVLQATKDAAVLVLGAYRDTDLVRTHPLAEMLVELRREGLVERVPMRGLSEDDVRALLGGPEADDELVHALWLETEGSPLFLREILRHLMETGAVVRNETGAVRPTKRIAQLGIPEGLREVIGRRLSRLSEEANVALRTGSVLGRELRLDVLERVTDLSGDRLIIALEEATTAGIVDELPGVGRWSFTHALVRQGLYEELSLTRRVRAHQQVGEALEALDGADDGPHLAQLAYHFAQAAVAGGAEKAIIYGQRAGEYATTLAAYEEAARHYAIAIEVAEDMGAANEVLVDLLFALATAQWQSSADQVGPRATLERAVPLIAPDDAARLAELSILYAGRAHRWIMLTMSPRAKELLELALAALSPDDSPLRARTLAALAKTVYFDEDPDNLSEHASREAVAMARRLGDPMLLATVLIERGLAFYGDAEQYREMVAELREVIDISTPMGQSEMLMEANGLLCLGHFALNDHAASMEAYRQWTALADELHDPNAALLAACMRAGFATSAGRFDEAERLYLEAFAIGQETRNPSAFIFMGPGMGAVRLLQGRVIEMIGTTSEYIDFMPHIRATMFGILALCYAECGMPDEARQFLRGVDFADPKGLPSRAVYLYSIHSPARAAFIVEDAELGRTLYDLNLPYSGMVAGFGPALYGTVDYSLGLAAGASRNWDLSDRHFEDAHRSHDRHRRRGTRDARPGPRRPRLDRPAVRRCGAHRTARPGADGSATPRSSQGEAGHPRTCGGCGLVSREDR